MIQSVASSVESNRAFAIASLRKKAKEFGANAVFGVKIEFEDIDIPNSIYTICVIIASGTALLLDKIPFDINSSDYKYPPYMGLIKR